MESIPVVLVAAIVTQLACQTFKVISGSLKERRLQLKSFFQSGGMPSSHAAFVSALSVAVGIEAGFLSDVFAVAAVFSFIVIHDAVRLRGTVERQGRIIEQLAKRSDDIRVDLPKTIGHSVTEIAVGMATGLICGAAVAVVF